MLTEEMIRMLLEELAHETVAEFDGYRVQQKTFGYSDDRLRGTTQAALSMMLERATKYRCRELDESSESG